MSTNSSAPPPPPLTKPPAISLGKPSLRHRLESYYSLISPDAISDAEKWKANFEIIHAKYGGTVEGERRLSKKLAKKYGDRVRLLVAPYHPSSMQAKAQRREEEERRQRQRGGSNYDDGGKQQRDESHYDIDDARRNSRVLDFTSPKFDAMHALNVPERIVMEANNNNNNNNNNGNNDHATLCSGLKLDNISKFRSFLPECDPQRLHRTLPIRQRNNNNNSNDNDKKNPTVPREKNVTATSSSSSSANPDKDNLETKKTKTKTKTPMFLSMSSRYRTKTGGGPLSLLYSIASERQRARIMIRYADCVRGTLTGYLIAFDKHFNMILRDADEVYGGRITRCRAAVDVAASVGDGGDDDDGAAGGTGVAGVAPSKSKLEAQRRRCYPPDGSGGPGPAVKQRYFHQLMVRGDNVIMVWRADAERSRHPLTSKSPARSSYECCDANDSIDNDVGAGAGGGGGKQQTKVGTPGSLYYSLQRWESVQQQQQQPSSYNRQNKMGHW